MSAHTPGPWRFWDREDHPFNRIITNDAGDAGIAAPIARIRGQELAKDEQAANARLIAAAPELLAELKKRRDCLAKFVLEDDEIAELDALIKKAEGKE